MNCEETSEQKFVAPFASTALQNFVAPFSAALQLLFRICSSTTFQNLFPNFCPQNFQHLFNFFHFPGKSVARPKGGEMCDLLGEYCVLKLLSKFLKNIFFFLWMLLGFVLHLPCGRNSLQNTWFWKKIPTSKWSAWNEERGRKNNKMQHVDPRNPPITQWDLHTFSLRWGQVLSMKMKKPKKKKHHLNKKANFTVPTT